MRLLKTSIAAWAWASCWSVTVTPAALMTSCVVAQALTMSALGLAAAGVLAVGFDDVARRGGVFRLVVDRRRNGLHRVRQDERDAVLVVLGAVERCFAARVEAALDRLVRHSRLVRLVLVLLARPVVAEDNELLHVAGAFGAVRGAFIDLDVRGACLRGELPLPQLLLGLVRLVGRGLAAGGGLACCHGSPPCWPPYRPEPRAVRGWWGGQP